MEALEKHLLTCQEMLLEIEQKVSVLSRLGSDPIFSQENSSTPSVQTAVTPPHQENGSTRAHQENGSTRAHQETSEILLHKLDLLKSSLVSFQKLLQDRQEETQAERPLQRTLRRSSSVQEILSSPRNRLLRQSSLQQQKELEQELEQQRGLTRALSRQSSRGRLYAQETEENQQTSPRPCPDVSPDSWLLKWARLHTELLSLEQLLRLTSSQVADASTRRGDGAAGSVIGEQAQKELSSLAGLTRELGESAMQGSGQDLLSLDEGWFHLLTGVSLSLSALTHLFHSPVCVYPEDVQQTLLQLQRLSSELQSLSRELVSQGSKITGVLGSHRGHECVEVVVRVVSVILTRLDQREASVRTQLDQTTVKQNQLKQLHAAFMSNLFTFQQITSEGTSLSLTEQLQMVSQVQDCLHLQSEQVNCLLQQKHHLPQTVIQPADQLQMKLDSAVARVSSRFVEIKNSVDLQQIFEQLMSSLQELLSVGHEHIDTQSMNTSLSGQDRLLHQINSHTKFFQFLQQHFTALQFLAQRFPENSQQTMENLQVEVLQLQRRGLETGARMEEIRQMWAQWEQDCEWMDVLLRDTKTSFPIMHREWDSDEHISNSLSVAQELTSLLEEHSARVGRLLESGLELQRAGCRGVGSVTRRLGVEWKRLTKRVDRERNTVIQHSKLRTRFLRDASALSEWMGGARELIDSQQAFLSANEEEDVCTSKKNFLQILDLSKDLESRSTLRCAVLTAASRLVKTRLTDPHLDTDQDQEKVPDPDPVSSRIQILDLEWSSLTTDLKALLPTLHKRWLQFLTQQGALQELQSWLSGAEALLNEEIHTSQTNWMDCLRICKDLQTEMAAHQATLDCANQPLPMWNTTEDHRGRCERNEFSEEQGRLNHQWLRLKLSLIAQVSSLEQELKAQTEAESSLQQVNIWTQENNMWMDSAQKPTSQTEIQRSLRHSEALEQKVKMQTEVLQELKQRFQNKTGNTIRELVSVMDETAQDCDTLRHKNDCLKQRLLNVQRLWNSVDEQLIKVRSKTMKISQTLNYNSGSHLSLQAHTGLNQTLQVLLEEMDASESDWDKLSESVTSLRTLVHPSAATIITDHTGAHRHKWSTVSDVLSQKIQKVRGLLSVWEVYRRLAQSLSNRLKTLQSDASMSLDTTESVNAEEQFTEKIQHIQTLLSSADSLQSDLQEVLDASKPLTSHLDPPASALVQSETRILSRGVLQLSQGLKLKLEELQEELERVQSFTEALTSLETDLELWDTRTSLDQQAGQGDVFGRSADMDVLNELSYSLCLSDVEAKRLLQLNQRWTQASARDQEAHSAMQTEVLMRQSFEQKCESWMCFLQKMEDSLAVDVAGSYQGLRQQLCIHKRFQAELSVGHQILHSVISEALHLLQRGEVDDRDEFLLKLSALRQHWQGAVQRAEQRRALIEGLVRHWHLYHRTIRKIHRFLTHTQSLLPPAGLSHCSIQELRRSLLHLKHTEVMFHRYQSSFLHTMEVGRQLFSMGDQDTQVRLQTELGTLQQDWDSLQGLLGRRMDLTEAIIKNWECCETGLANSELRLKDVKTRLNQSLPESEEDLQTAERFMKEKENLIVDWAESLSDLSTMKTDLSQYIMTEDVLLLQEQVDHLHGQWDQLCIKVSLRKQEIADRLNAWIIFNEKNKELCEWLTQMENKVAHSSDLNIEEMVEKLKKDCMEEMNLFSENKTHLKKLGEQLITASNKTKETEVNEKLTDINDRWQHLFDHIQTRVSKLKETLVTVQQLDKNMSNLRTWLSRIETELSQPVVYSTCHNEEIQRRLQEQQDLQRDIDQHTDSVASVLTLCDVLLHDTDACGSDSENDSIQQTTLSLDRRWRNICAMSMERRMRIEETWRLWSKFLDDYSRFEDWLKSAELTAANPESENVLYTCAKEELKRFEAFQRQVHERLTQLELVNKQYRRLARENRTDAASKLKVMVHEGNQRWDVLQRRVSAVLRRLKYFTSQREDFEGTREGILVWLTEMDLQLTNVEHFSESDIHDKMRQLNGFQQEITLNTNKIDALIVFGENLIQKSVPLDAVLIEDELEELHSYCQEVFGRVARFHQRLVNRQRPMLDDISDSDLDDSLDLRRGTSWTETKRRRRRKRMSNDEAGHQVMCQLLVPPLTTPPDRSGVCHLLVPPLERSGRETPVSVDSIPLEWDHTVDVGGSSSHEDDDDATFFSALSVKSVADRQCWRQNESPKGTILQGLDASTCHQRGYVKLMSECSGSIDSLKKVKLILNDEEELNDSGLTNSTADKQTNTGVIERWELLRAQSLHTQSDLRQDLQQWHKLNSDLCDVTSWLGRVLPELDRLQHISPSTGIKDVEGNITKLKEMQRSFSSYKCLMISVNLSSRHLLLTDTDSPEVDELKEALDSTNHSWTQACSGLETWEHRLYQGLIQCQEFHETLHSLLLWLAQSENKMYSVNIRDQTVSRSSLIQHRDTLKSLQEDLCGRQQQVSSLQDISSELLLETSSEEGLEAKEKVHVIHNKLRLLLRHVNNDITAINTRLETPMSWSSEMDSVGPGPITHSTVGSQKEDLKLHAAPDGPPAMKRELRRDAAPQRPFLSRVFRAAFPLHLLFLLVLVLACLVPLSEDNYSCALSNNFARSFYPMLRYTNGPPPT